MSRIIKGTVGPEGQVVIPKDVRGVMGISPGDDIFIEVEGTSVMLHPAPKNDDFLENFLAIPRKLDARIDIERQLDEEHG